MEQTSINVDIMGLEIEKEQGNKFELILTLFIVFHVLFRCKSLVFLEFSKCLFYTFFNFNPRLKLDR